MPSSPRKRLSRPVAAWACVRSALATAWPTTAPARITAQCSTRRCARLADGAGWGSQPAASAPPRPATTARAMPEVSSVNLPGPSACTMHTAMPKNSSPGVCRPQPLLTATIATTAMPISTSGGSAAAVRSAGSRRARQATAATAP